METGHCHEGDPGQQESAAGIGHAWRRKLKIRAEKAVVCNGDTRKSISASELGQTAGEPL
jgi:hypothetical protein